MSGSIRHIGQNREKTFLFNSKFIRTLNKNARIVSVASWVKVKKK